MHRDVFTTLQARCPDEGVWDHRGRYGEDMSFFLRCREAGIPCYATPLVQSIHLMSRGIQDEDYTPGWFPMADVQVAVPVLTGG